MHPPSRSLRRSTGARASDAVDAIVIGGGPAGAAAACCLASWGHPTLLVTRRAAGPSLAESLPPSVVALLERIGVRAAVEEARFVRAAGNTVWWGDEPVRREPFAAGVSGFQVGRAVFDRLLLRRAAAAGAVVRRRSTVLEASSREDGNPARVVLENDEGRHEVFGHWVLDCTGRAGLVARRGWRRVEAAARTLALIGVRESAAGFGLDDETHTLVESSERGWAWSVPFGATRRCFTVMIDPALTPVATRKGLADAWHAELARTRHLGRIAERGRPVGAPWARDASPYACTRAGAPGLLLVGDAASFVDPLSSFGVKKALASAWLAAVVVHTALADTAMLAPALELHERRERAMFRVLSERSSMLAREAAGAHGAAFWDARAMCDPRDPADDDTDVTALRQDPAVLGAFAELRSRPSAPLRRSPAVREVLRPTVRDNRVVLVPHLRVPAFGDGVRYLRNVDLLALASMAPAFDQVPDLYEAYNRGAPPVPLPDFLGALSVLIGKGVLEFAD